jgi:hypothetical protein
MSESTASVSVQQEHVQEQAAEPASHVEPQEQAEQQPATGQKVVDKLLREFESIVRKASTATLEQGRVCAEYIRARMGLSEKVSRRVCVETLANTWQEYSDTVITPNRVSEVIRCHAAWNILSGGQPSRACKVSLRVVREFAPLCERSEEDRTETWTLTDHFVSQALELWEEATSKGLTGNEIAEAVAKIIADYRARDAAEKARIAADNPQDQKAQAVAASAQAVADKAADKALAAEQKAKGKKDSPAAVAPPCEQPVQPLLKTAAVATPKDLAEQLVAAMYAHPQPDDVLEALLTAYRRHKDVSKVGKRTCDAGILSLTRKQGPSPLEVAAVSIPSENSQSLQAVA